MYNKNTIDKILNNILIKNEKQILYIAGRILLKNKAMSESDVKNVIQITSLYLIRRLKREPLIRKDCLGYFITCLKFRAYDYLKAYRKNSMANIDNIDEKNIKHKL